MKLVLHLGTYKTGTTSIQNRLWANRDRLLQRGVLFPRTGVTETWHIGHRHNRFLYGKHAVNAEITSRLVQEIRESGAQKVILSYEAWCSLGNIGRFDVFLRQLESEGLEDLNGVLALRNRARFVVSHYREFTVNSVNTRDYAEYIEQRAPFAQYAPMVHALQGALDGRLALIDFDAQEDIFPAFCDAADLPEALDLPPSDWNNEKPGDALDVEARRLMRLARLDGPPRVRRLPEVLAPFRAKHAAPEGWTERFPGDLAPAWPAQITRLARLTGWPTEGIERLLHIPPPLGRPVAEVSAALRAHLVEALS